MDKKTTKWLFFSLLFLGNTVALAQESYFNVPESDVAKARKLTVQQQFSIQDYYRSLTTFDYGLGKDWEIGANLLNLDYYPVSKQILRNDSTSERAYSPLLMLNGQKIFKLPHGFHVGLGAQVGYNLTPTKNQRRLVSYGYANLNKQFYKEHYKLTAGLYSGHTRYLGAGPQVGFQAGFEAGIFYQKLHLIGDWISGQHDVGQLALGLELFLSKSVPLAIGWQRSNQNGTSALIVQLTYMPD
ncbi:hypothetical protein J2I46_15185 [Fibrella sp. HMF5405]|uniref:Outer membrane protein beta-barrel domain-containing protein n=2 Tax=Fibrella forsythiae TaxID=2817061 RepID=A0ABS3JIV0_9BACT|nr:hypothetical protein [Fibrella forsythiae]